VKEIRRLLNRLLAAEEENLMEPPLGIGMFLT